MQLIVHADDFGLSEKINEGIISAHKDGILTSTSIMACGGAFDHAVTLSRLHGTLDIGIHLTLIEERPILLPDIIPSLVKSDGRFYPHAKYFIGDYLKGKISSDEIRLEFTEQIEKVLDSGIKISHIDSHQHIHILPGVFKITLSLARKYGIRSIRYPDEKLRFYMFNNIAGYPRLLQLFIVKAILKFVNKGNNIYPRFHGFYYGGKLNKTNLSIVINHINRNGVHEIMCHPGLRDVMSEYSHWKYNWQDELEALTDINIRSFINNKNISLISYREL